MDLKAQAFIRNFYLAKEPFLKKSKPVIMFTANKNIFHLVQCYTSFTEIRYSFIIASFSQQFF